MSDVSNKTLVFSFDTTKEDKGGSKVCSIPLLVRQTGFRDSGNYADLLFEQATKDGLSQEQVRKLIARLSGDYTDALKLCFQDESSEKTTDSISREVLSHPVGSIMFKQAKKDKLTDHQALVISHQFVERYQTEMMVGKCLKAKL